MVVIGDDELRSLIPLDTDITDVAQQMPVVVTGSANRRDMRYALRGIRIENFKSYSGVIEVSRFPDDEDESLICVVGPNGAGKSNFMDAVAFCFNCADSTKLRGEGNLSNLISAGLPPSQNAVASVMVTLETSSKVSVTFTRTVNSRNESKYKLNSKTVTLEKYREKMVECGLDVRGNFLVFQGDVESLALSTPTELGSTIDRVSGSSQYKREYDSFKDKKNELEHSLTSLLSRRRHLTSDRKRLASEQAEIDKLKSLKSEVAALRSKRALVDLYAIQCESDRLSVETESEAMEVDWTSLTSNLEELKSKRAKTDLSKSKTERSIVRAKETLSGAQTVHADHVQKLNSLRTKEERIKADLDSQAVGREQLRSQIGKLSDQIVVEESAHVAAVDDMQQWISRRAGDPDFETDEKILVPFLSARTGRQMDMSEFKSISDVFRKYKLSVALGDVREKLAQVDAEKLHAISTVDMLTQKESEMSNQLARNVSSERTATSKREEFEKVVSESSDELKKLSREMESTKSRMARFSGKLDELLERKQVLIDSLSTAKESEEQIAKEKCIVDIVSDLEMKFGARKIFGRIVDLIIPSDPKWATAVEIASGKYLDGILVADTEVARECNNFLKQIKSTRKIPSLTFIPVVDVTVPAPVVVGDCKRVFDVFTIKDRTSTLPPADAEYVQMCIQRGLEFVFNDCVLSSNLKEGRQVAFTRSVKVVTMNGEKISGKSGTITIGGLAAGKGGKRFDVKQVAEINSKLDVIETQISATRADICALQGEMDKLGRNVRSAEMTVNEAVRNRDIWKAEGARIAVQIDAVSKTLRSVREERDGIREKIKEIDMSRELVVDEIEMEVKKFTSEWLSTTFPGLRVDDPVILMQFAGTENDPRKSTQNQFEEIRTGKRKRINEIESRIESLKNERRFLKEKLDELVEQVREFEAEQKAVLSSIKKAEKEVEKSEKEKDVAEEKMKKLQSELDSLLAERNMLDTEIKQVTISLNESVPSGVSSSSIRVSVKSRLAELSNRAVQVLKQSVFENVLVPLVLDDTELMDNANTEQMSRNIVEALYMSFNSVVPFGTQMLTQNESQDSLENLTKEVLSKIDYTQLESAIRRQIERASRQGDGVGVRAAASSIRTDLEDQIKSKSGEIEKVNVHSIGRNIGQDWASLDTQLETVNSDIETVKSELATTVNELRRIRVVRNELFMKCFDFVSAKVGELYKVLTSYEHGCESEECGQDVTSIVPASTAVACLDLESAVTNSSEAEIFNSGIIFSLMPPFKRYTNIELLSGGEKTVAAVALLFSMLSFSSPPFAMVDEIDAALDAGNVAVLSRFMKRAVTHPLIVISLKEKMYSKADYLIGVYKDLDRGGSSGIVTIDLRAYSEESDEPVAAMGG